MSAALEIFLARLYGNALEAESFLRERAAYARAAGLPEEHLQDVLAIDAGALRFAAQSFERKRRSSQETPSTARASLREHHAFAAHGDMRLKVTS